MSTQQAENLVLEVNQEIEIAAPPGDVYRGLIDHLTGLQTGPDNEPIPMTLEEWPGGRWFRDLGSGTGHLWGFVQSIKPPTLIEIYGPMFMSYAVASNLIIRIETISTGACVKLRHQILGAIPEDYREGIGRGWNRTLEDTKKALEQ